MPSPLVIQACVAALCLAGLYVSVFMLRKYGRARRGEVTEPSVVMTPRASLARVPNAGIGIVFYSLLLAFVPFLSTAHPLAVHVALAASALAALASVYLAYSLLFVTRMACVYCWTGHVINWSLLGLLSGLEMTLSR